MLPQIFGKLKADRGKLMSVENSKDVMIKDLNLRNSPSWHLLLDDVLRVEVRNLTVTVDRERQRELKESVRKQRFSLNTEKLGKSELASLMTGLEPEDLNTDG